MDGKLTHAKKKKRQRTRIIERSTNITPIETGSELLARNLNAVRNIPEMIAQVMAGKAEIDATVLAVNSEGRGKVLRITEGNFKKALTSQQKTLKIREDAFATDCYPADSSTVGKDFVPLLGGPFNKQQYTYDYQKAHMESFFAFNHDPIARNVVTTYRDFTLGRDFRCDAMGKDKEIAQIVWDATFKVNKIDQMMDMGAIETSIYGEMMVWELPDGDTQINYDRKDGELKDPKNAIFPRFRLIDPSCIWDIITVPEDPIEGVIAYQWVAPTQYQTYSTSGKIKEPTLKYIYQQIPASAVDHYKINVVSNEKRGRGDLYPVLGYLKWLRDTISYKVISELKNASWAIDTTIDGSQDDIDSYVSDQASKGTIQEAGSEFVHTKKITREYRTNSGAGGSHKGGATEDCLDMIAAGTGIPVNYFGGNNASGGSRASAMVATEPVVKRFEMRRKLYERVLQNMFDRTMKKFNLDAYCEVTFPEIVSQDRAAKLADIQLGQTEGWISQERAATMASKEFSITKFDFEKEQDAIKKELAEDAVGYYPLTAPGAAAPGGSAPGPVVPQAPTAPKSAQPGSKPPVPPLVPKMQAPVLGAAGKDFKSLEKPGRVTQDSKRDLTLGRGK